MAIRQIESVQRQFTKRLPGCAHLDYASRLSKLNIQSLELRRLHLDLLYVYKILFGLVDIVVTDLFSPFNNCHNTRGHAFKLKSNNCRVNIRQHYFAERVINPWNSLHAEVKDFESLASFKRCLYKNNLETFIAIC